jgi:hypothetical protein
MERGPPQLGPPQARTLQIRPAKRGSAQVRTRRAVVIALFRLLAVWRPTARVPPIKPPAAQIPPREVQCNVRPRRRPRPALMWMLADPMCPGILLLSSGSAEAPPVHGDARRGIGPAWSPRSAQCAAGLGVRP